MNAERMREFLLSLPHVVEAQQWGGLIYWVGDKSIGGKMFAMLNPEGAGEPITFPTPPERFAELIEQDGLTPARYLARLHWVTAARWDVFRTADAWLDELTEAHTLTFAKLPPRTKAVLALPAVERRRVVNERRKLLAAKAAAKAQAKPQGGSAKLEGGSARKTSRKPEKPRAELTA